MLERKSRGSLGSIIFTTSGLGLLGISEYALYNTQGTAFDKAMFTGLVTVNAFQTYFGVKDVSEAEMRERKYSSRPKLAETLKKAVPIFLTNAAVIFTAAKYGDTIPVEVFQGLGVAETTGAIALGLRARRSNSRSR